MLVYHIKYTYRVAEVMWQNVMILRELIVLQQTIHENSLEMSDHPRLIQKEKGGEQKTR